jgi:O-antigen ligase
VIGILLVINFLYWKYSKIESIWDRLIGMAFLTVAAGTPIIFTSLTRSVFEVSKLIDLRFALIWITVVVLVRAVVTKEKIVLVKTPINWALLAYAVVTTISTILSSNHYIALLGAYDRWDGLITELNYVLFIWYYLNFVKERRTIYWLIGALLVGSVSSAIYGIFQANGVDFMRWSVDPTARVFGCINNPVHYAPYINMHVFLLIGFIFFLLGQYHINFNKISLNKNGFLAFVQENKLMLMVYGIMTCIFILYYVSGFLSFGRATWIGSSMAISFMLYFLYVKNTKVIFFDMLIFALGIALVNVLAVFKIYGAHGGKFIPIVACMLLAYAGLLWYKKTDIKRYVLYTAFIIYGGIMQFVMVDFWHLSLNLIIAGATAYFFVDEDKLKNIIKVFLLFMMVLSVAIPSYEALLASLKDNSQEQLQGTELNVSWKAKSYASDFQKGTARSSMWLTALAAWKDYPVFGVGPGMVKEIYPTYRRPDYGRLEGGHNFTPDQFHNDYVSMLATRGIVGFLVYFGWFLPLCGYVVLKKIRDEGMLSGNYILAGLFAGLFVHLGQTIFNFGVVATRILFYEFLCLALVIALYDPFQTTKGDQQ